jgi:membrane protein implicated in regulation of membrane protease activity
MEWWGWLAMGLLLLMGELLAPGGFFIFFFGIGALIVGALAGLGLLGAPWLEWVLFAIISPVLLVAFRDRLLHKAGINNPGMADRTGLIGEFVVLKEPLDADGIGRAEFRGVSWSIKNSSGINLEAGERVKVIKVVGVTLEVSKAS